MTINASWAQTDFYKMFHKSAYHPDITKVYSNYTSRNGRLSNVKDNKEVVFVGLQYFIKDVLIKEWNETFFNLPKHAAIRSIKRITDSCLGFDYDASHFEDLHDLGYLPLEIKALPEGVSVPYGVPPVTFVNTVDGFQWLSNYIETSFSTENWPIQTSATTAREYLRNTIGAFDRAGLPHDLVPFMCHDFSMRGCFGRHAAAISGFGHLCSFAGTDTIPAILFAERYYNANVENELVGTSVPATEHSTATSYITSMAEEKGITKLEAEVEYVRYLMDKVPTGILSHVSDSFDFWKFVSEGLPMLKEDILKRDGKLVVRPDSGDPVKVLCGYTADEVEYSDKTKSWYKKPYDDSMFDSDGIYEAESVSEWEVKGLIECLGDIFGTTESPTGLKLLHDNIGAIYGDSITLERQKEIIKRLEAKGYAAMVVLGVGSYSYQYVTRDTHGSAVKATWVEKAGKGVDVFKDPKTDSKKKSAKGLLRIEKENGKYVVYDQQTPEQEKQGLLETVFKDGKLLRETSLSEIRERVKQSL
ncbi:nicotinamide phosphoribosyl transferase [Vibrio phage qdvp001]|uniref:nicotinamide phosphoribosyl transferase n=1 Tax=Vibrio phage qdvp001 TaxID=1003177 RepID=UPI0007217F9E|nr:nicotinamide phosphoribosyl transferase [Vibrio phage qdvp001]ALM62213.1 nicotinate phosphoribosyltransferase [Vibrio phage qdvp001]